MAKAPENSRVAVLGASPKEDRFSFKAVRMLGEYGHQPLPIHPAGHTVDGIESARSISELTPPIDTLTVYVRASISDGEEENILKLNPRRVVFNPGAENSGLAEKLRAAGIEAVEDCTLILLGEGRF